MLKYGSVRKFFVDNQTLTVMGLGSLLLSISMLAYYLEGGKTWFADRIRSFFPTEVRIEPAEIDLGEVNQDQKVSGFFYFVNNSRSEVEIISVQTSCTCTSIKEELIGRRICNREKLVIPVNMETEERDGKIDGKINIAFRQVDSAGKIEVTSAALVATVIPDFRLVPAKVDFGKVNHYGKISQIVRLVSVAKKDVEVTDFANHCSGVVSMQLADCLKKNDDSVPLEVSFCGRDLHRSQFVVCPIYVKTNSTRFKNARIDISVNFQAPVEINPETLLVDSHKKEVQKAIIVKTVGTSRVVEVKAPQGVFIQFQ